MVNEWLTAEDDGMATHLLAGDGRFDRRAIAECQTNRGPANRGFRRVLLGNHQGY